MEAEAALKAVREAATSADKQRHSTRAELDEVKERYRPAYFLRVHLMQCRYAVAAGTG
jgi:hypothetical protein